MTEATSEPGPLRGAGSFITGLGIAQICSWGTLYYAFPQIAAAMELELGWSKTELYGAATVGLLLSALVAVPVGTAIDRGYGRWIMSGGSVLAGLLLIAWGWVGSLALFYVLLAGVGAMQAATLYEPAFAVIARRAGPHSARNGITALTLWGGFASTVFIPLTQILLDQMGWRLTLEVLGATNIVVCGALYYAVIDPRRDQYRPPPHEDGARQPIRAAMRQPVFWGLAAAFTLFTATFSAFTYHLYPIMLERGFTAQSVVFAMAFIGPAQVAGRILVRIFMPSVSARRLGSVVVVGFPIAMGLLLVGPPLLWVVCAVALIYGAANGIMTIVRGIAIPEMVSRDGYGAINGALAVPMVLARALSPLAAAWLWALSGSYAGVLMALVALAMTMAGAFWWAATRPPRA
ncbi:MFS transporter [Devosia sp. A16]|uniref:MFS transporter n=1 Tax=Devosia sp. A16 TaxID=1736675 RepID=UPI0006D850C1|nr:MFS transporter [Devosia sp. A16]